MKKHLLCLISLFILTCSGIKSQSFIHPGGLHTQADFDRVKTQLAANETAVVQAYNNLKANAYSASNVITYPVETIIRGGGSGENYINAARGAAMAYQNALRWKISGDAVHAERAITILNSWAKICKQVTGDTNQSLASGLYGYQFANAAELMRDYTGWKQADFKAFQEWMLYIWYPRCVDFLKRRHDTNAGHYWSNWGLCNVLAVMSIGILCDDVFIYNQGLDYYRYDLVGTFTDNRTPPIDNNGYNEFLGNLVPVLHADSRGPLGYLGQMQESGRDQGHALMALGLAIDICQVGYNQGDDLFAHMDNRIAAGIEYVACYNSGVNNVPWWDYWYHDVRTSYENSWKQTANNDGGRGAFRPYWDRVIGHYEGIKGISMTYSHTMKNKESIDNGGGNYGQTSGGFDHLGFSTLMCTRPVVTPTQVPTPLSPVIIRNNVEYARASYSGVTVGSTLKLLAKLPADVTNTGNWKWDTGETTQELTVTANNSALYHVTYTNANNVKSTQMFSIAVSGDCKPDLVTPSITYNGVTVNDTVISIMPQTPFRLTANSPNERWGKYKWSNGATANSITVSTLSTDRIYSVTFTNQGGKETTINFHISISVISPSLKIDGGNTQNTNKAFITAGQSVELLPIVQAGAESGTWTWSNGSTQRSLLLEFIQETEHHTVTYSYNSAVYTLNYDIYVTIPNKPMSNGNYFIKNAADATYLTNDGSMTPSFSVFSETHPESQRWTITKDGTRYKIASMLDNRFLNEYAAFTTNAYYQAWNTYTFHGLDGADLYAIQNGGSSAADYWAISGSVISGHGSTTLNAYPFEIISYQLPNGIAETIQQETHIYPNPVNDFLTINIAGNTGGKFVLYSIDGRKMYTIICVTGKNHLNIGNFTKGMYVGVLELNGKTEQFKILKK
ncbi:MAG: hypothetical protein EZS26_000931 [Candidatus Ordinivivax streblomastigis]|uniref:T9SS C-terminal target domain-containing protein n=1 Tax=Candidatus Ordinivivax streblomastigis TaxID=2540710 RepID=A0A5M8P2W7_9BACT|nr:MAG: hypothetical protein EZS26_000931 [Candidatus Ordinivivax streblomastigis]